MQICAVHGLRYDATQHSGCVMCRRGTTDEAVDPEVREHNTALKIGKAGGAAVLVFAVLGLMLTLSSAPEPPPTAAPLPPAAEPAPPSAPSEQPGQVAAAPVVELPPVLAVASLEGQKPQLVPRLQLERAKERCLEAGPFAGGDYACLIAITPMLELLTQIPVSTSKSVAPVRAYEVNRTGLGFDCLWFEAPELSNWKEPGRREPKRYPYAALLVASPKDRHARVSLDAKREPLAVAFERAPFPAGYEAHLSYDDLSVPTHKGSRDRKAAAKRYAACMSFEHTAPVTLYVGATAFIGESPKADLTLPKGLLGLQ